MTASLPFAPWLRIVLLLAWALARDLRPCRADAAVTHEESAQAAAQDDVAASRRNAIVRAVERVSPSVVSINTTHYKPRPQVQDPFLDFFRHPELARERVPGIGSGFVIREDGYILTNSHVVEGAREITVIFPNGDRYPVREVGSDVMVDRQHDLAVIRIDTDGLPVPAVGDAGGIIIGEWAIAIGNPFGLTLADPRPTVTVGVISATARNFRPEEDGRVYQNMIQTDASINPGNSGGPLVNALGEVIGINTFIFSSTGGSLGIGFAIPINTANQIAQRLIDGDPDFWTGLVIHNMNPRIARAFRLSTVTGALITSVEERSPGQKAGLMVRDVIMMVNGFRVRSADEVVEAFRAGRVGSAYNLTVLRGRVLVDARLVLERDPNI